MAADAQDAAAAARAVRLAAIERRLSQETPADTPAASAEAPVEAPAAAAPPDAPAETPSQLPAAPEPVDAVPPSSGEDAPGQGQASRPAAPQQQRTGDEEDVPADFECSICMKLLLEPVSVPCGHTFCKQCLEQSLGYRGLCAVCRSPVAGVQAVNVLIRGVIEERYPRALERRREEQEEDARASEQEAEEQRRREVQGPAAEAGVAAVAAAGVAGAAGAPVLPLLRCPRFLLPHCKTEFDLRSHVEARLLDYALQGGRRFGALSGTPGDDAAIIGVCMEIESVERQPQRLPRLRLAGKFRFRLMEAPQLHEDGFELGRCEAFFDTPLPLADLTLPADGGQPPAEDNNDEAANTTLPEIARAAMELLNYQIACLGQGGRRVCAEHLGDTPALSVRGGTATSAGMEHLSFWLLGAIVSEEAFRLRWLASTDTRGRLEASLARLQEAGGRSVLDLPGARSWMRPGQSGHGSLALLVVIIALLICKALGVFDWQQQTGSQRRAKQFSNNNDFW